MYDILQRVFCAVYRLFGGKIIIPGPEVKPLNAREPIIDCDEATLTKIIYYYKDDKEKPQDKIQ